MTNKKRVGPTPKRFKVIEGTLVGDPSVLKPCTARISEERLTPKERKERFASNLDRLLALVGVSRRDAAVEIGISYPLLKRLVTAGVSRTEDRNLQSLTRIKEYFGVGAVDDLWRIDLIHLLLTRDTYFTDHFRPRLLAVRERRLEETGSVRRKELSLLNRALGFADTAPPTPLTGDYAEKLASVLGSPKGATFLRLIDDYYELVSRTRGGQDDRVGARA